MQKGTNEYKEADLEFECDACDIVTDWLNWKITDFHGIIYPQENGEQRIIMKEIIFICPNCQTKNIVSWCAIITSIAESRLSPN